MLCCAPARSLCVVACILENEVQASLCVCRPPPPASLAPPRYGSEMNERKWLARFLYLETVAGVPGMVSGMLRHLRSLRTMQRDNGW